MLNKLSLDHQWWLSVHKHPFVQICPLIDDLPLVICCGIQQHTSRLNVETIQWTDVLTRCVFYVLIDFHNRYLTHVNEEKAKGQMRYSMSLNRSFCNINCKLLGCMGVCAYVWNVRIIPFNYWLNDSYTAYQCIYIHIHIHAYIYIYKNT